jgi:hypothetical protein
MSTFLALSQVHSPREAVFVIVLYVSLLFNLGRRGRQDVEQILYLGVLSR